MSRRPNMRRGPEMYVATEMNVQEDQEVLRQAH